MATRQHEAAAETAARGDAGRAAIMDAAAEMFMLHGYSATSIDDVARALGATKGRVYHYYRSKADLFFDVHKRALEQNLEGVRPLLDDPAGPLDRLRRMVHAHAMLMMTQLPYQRVSVQGVEMHLVGSTTARQRERLREVIDMRRTYEEAFVRVLDEGVAAGELRPCAPRLVAKALLGALNWITVWYRPRDGESEADREAIAAEFTAYLVDGLRAV